MRCAILLCLAALTATADQLDEARHELRAGHVDAAIAILRDQIAKDPAIAAPSILLAETLIDQENFADADQVMATALAKNSSDAVLNRVLGDLRYREGRILEADAAYKAAIQIDPRNARAIFGISRVFQASCLRKKAFDMLRVAHAIDFHDPLIAGAFFSTDRRSKAGIARMQAELDHHSDSADAHADPDFERRLRTWIAEAKAVDGKVEFEVAAPGTQHQIPLSRLMDGRRATGFGLPIKIKDAKAELRLDTGAGGILLSSRFAERAGIERLGASEISGIGNGPSLEAWVGFAPQIQIGDVEFRNCIVEVAGKGSPDDSSGLIGSDVFRRFLVKINLAAQRLDLDPLPGPAWDGSTPVDRYAGPELAGFAQMFIIHHYLLVPTLVSQSTREELTAGLFLLDSGARTNMISTNLAPAVTKVRDSEYRKVRGLSGNVQQVYEADKIVLQFANFRQLNLGLTSFDLSSFSRSADVEVSGLIGMPLIGMFESLTLDYRDGRIKFDYKR
jgi:tetratricopeptide (TPR) repeat protein